MQGLRVYDFPAVNVGPVVVNPLYGRHKVLCDWLINWDYWQKSGYF